MSDKKQLNEGVVSKVLTSIWAALLKNKKDVLLKKLERDPEFQKNVQELDKLRKEMEERLEYKRKHLPGFKENEKQYLDWLSK